MAAPGRADPAIAALTGRLAPLVKSRASAAF